MKLTTLITILLIFVLAFTGFNCKSSEDPIDSGDPSDLVGTWAANAATAGTQMVFEEPVSGFSLDVLQLGASVNVTMASNGDYTLALTMPGSDPEVEVGKATFSGNQVTMTPTDFPEDAITFTWSLNGDLLTLFSDETEFAFDGENDVPAELTLILKKVVG